MSQDGETQLTSSSAQTSSQKRWLPTINAGLVNGILIIIFQSAYAALIFSGEFSGHLANGIGFMLFGAFVMGIISSLTSSFYGTITIPQAAPAAILSLIATAIAGSISAAGSSETVFTTVVIAIAFTSLLTGTFLLLLGRFKLGNLIRFIPYPVVGGFLAGTGWLLVRGAIGIMTDITPGIAQFPHFFQPDVLVKWLPGLIFAILLFFILRHYHQFWILPVMILGAIILFYIVVFLSQASLAEVSTSGWLLAHFPEGTLWKPPPPAALSNVDWWIILSQIGNMGTIIIISVITLLLSASGLELIIQEEINLNRELQSTGIANMAAGLGASPVGYMSLALSALGFRIGANRRAAGIIAAGLCGITLVFGATIFSYFPKPLLGGLLIFLGLSFLFEWVYETWFKLPKAEYLLLLSILIIIGVFGFLEGVSVGLLIAVILFVVNYSRIDVVKHALSGANYQSNVDRAAPYQRLLRKKGDQLYILKLQGFIFFGTANNLLDQVRQRLNNSSLPALNYLILDFRLVNGLDSSALNSFTKMKMLEDRHDFTLVFTHLSSQLKRQFEIGGFIEGENSRFKVFPDLDHGVEWCENQILKHEALPVTDTLREKEGIDFLTSLFEIESKSLDKEEHFHSFVSSMMKYLKREEFEEGSYLLQQGNPPVGLYFIESGQVTAQLEETDGQIVRLRKMGAGTVVGEMGVYLGIPATASVVTNQKCVVLFLSLENLRRMEEMDPAIAAIFHKFIARVLGDRLAHTNRTVRALMD